MNDGKTILIADDDKDLLRLLRTRCEQLGLNVVTTGDAMTALTSVEKVTPDLVCLDVNMPAGNGLSVAEMIVTNETLRDTPVIMITGERDHDIEKRCCAMAVYYVPKCENTWLRLRPLICELLQVDECETSDAIDNPLPDDSVSETRAVKENQTPDEPDVESQSVDAMFSALGWDATFSDLSKKDDQAEAEAEEPWVLSIDDDSDLSFSMKVRLAEHGIDLLRAFGGMEGVRCAYTSMAQAIILDYEMPDVNGDYVLRRLKDNPVTGDIPVIVLTGHNNNALKRKMYNLGASAFLTKPVRWIDLWNELRKHVNLPVLSAN